NLVQTFKETRAMFRRTSRSHHTVPVFEPLEDRRLYSAVPGSEAVGSGQSLLSQSVAVNDIGFRRHDLLTGSVGNSQSHAVYSFNVTDPVNLRVVLARLKQTDQVRLLFA